MNDIIPMKVGQEKEGSKMIKKTKFEARRVEWSPFAGDNPSVVIERTTDDIYRVTVGADDADVPEAELHSLIDAINYVLGGDSPLVEQSDLREFIESMRAKKDEFLSEKEVAKATEKCGENHDVLPPSNECGCKEEPKSTVDFSKLQVGDSVRLRDGDVEVVEEIQSVNDPEFYKWEINGNPYTNDGGYYWDVESGLDIVEIIPKNPKKSKNKSAKTKVCRKGRPWTDKQDQTLMAKWNAHVPAARIAQGEKRTKSAVYARIRFLRSLHGEDKVPFRKEDSHGN